MGSFTDELEQITNEWEARVISRLQVEYGWKLSERKLHLRSVLIVLTDSESFWARWVPQTRTIEFSRSLVLKHPWHVVTAILAHEMAHQYVDEKGLRSADHGPHGDSFRQACVLLGVPNEYRRASVNLQTDTLDWRTERRDDVTEKMLDRVRKLLALASSANEHEAALAMNRVRELYAKYNLEDAPNTDFVQAVIRMGKRIEAFENKIASLLIGHFFVEVIFGTDFDPVKNVRHRSVTLIGRRENVMMAEYVFHFLRDQSLRLLNTVKGLDRADRRSYRLGILAGFEARLIEAEKPAEVARSAPTISRALVAFKKDRELGIYMKEMFPRLSSSSTRGSTITWGAYSAGQSAGRELTLNKPVTGRAGFLGKLLG